MNTYTMFTEINGGWIMVFAEIVIVLICTIFLYRVLENQDIGARSRILISTGFFLINAVAFEILVSVIFFPGGEYFHRGAAKGLAIDIIVLTIPIILTAVIALTIRLLRTIKIAG